MQSPSVFIAVKSWQIDQVPHTRESPENPHPKLEGCMRANPGPMLRQGIIFSALVMVVVPCHCASSFSPAGPQILSGSRLQRSQVLELKSSSVIQGTVLLRWQASCSAMLFLKHPNGSGRRFPAPLFFDPVEHGSVMFVCPFSGIARGVSGGAMALRGGGAEQNQPSGQLSSGVTVKVLLRFRMNYKTQYG